ncbi:winged helix-turn-helix domain-containing protein [Tabrizicola sp.]|uniref:winged helix-turn-helix domain-containing protein n=1 Tax=Tabrizicola sp. TaxID=2005166 RepID=UPI0025EC2380|nr:winged helix-turn-helix domain-containing protein [Tabrizicola sp.]
MIDPVQPHIELLRSLRRLRIDGSEQVIGARAFDVLAYLDAHSGRVVTKAELLEHVWADLNVEESNLTVQIATLRKLIGARAIATVPGVGYQLTLAATSPADPEKALPLPDKPSLAVLPFANLTGDAGKDYLVDGIVSDLIGTLSRIPTVFVIGANTSFTFKGRSVDLAEVGRQLGVRYILEGGIQVAGDRLRINTQLVDAAAGHTIWSQRFDGALDEIFALQDQVSAQIAAVIEPNLILAEQRHASSKPTTDLMAYDLCQQAAMLAHRVAYMESFTKAKALLERAIALDPDYAQAKALMCRLYLVAYGARFISIDEARTALPLAEEILESSPADPLVLTYAGHLIGYVGGQSVRAAGLLRQALGFHPNSSFVLISSGYVHTYAEELDIAADHFRRAIRLDPLAPNTGHAYVGLGLALLMAGQVDAAISTLEQALTQVPEMGTLHQFLTVAYWSAGRKEEAARHCSILMQKVPDLTISGLLNDMPQRLPSFRVLVEAALRGLGVPE